MYAAVPDPYCYPGSDVLRNIPGLRDAADLERFEAAITAQRAEEPLPHGRFGAAHYRAVHRHLFQDVYRWAGRFRSVRIAKGDNAFCYPENIAPQMAQLFHELNRTNRLRGLDRDGFAAGAAHFLAELNAIHPFREGNGRTQMVFLALLAAQAGHPLGLSQLDPIRWLDAMIASFHGREEWLASEIQRMI